MLVEIGRPRDHRIDSAVLETTSGLTSGAGYASLFVDAIAGGAVTSKPAIYRRWPSKARLGHEAVFPVAAYPELPSTGSTLGDVREMMARTFALLTTPAAV